MGASGGVVSSSANKKRSLGDGSLKDNAVAKILPFNDSDNDLSLSERDWREDLKKTKKINLMKWFCQKYVPHHPGMCDTKYLTPKWY